MYKIPLAFRILVNLSCNVVTNYFGVNFVGDCSLLWDFGRKSKITLPHVPMSLWLMMLLTITPRTLHTCKKTTMDINERFCWKKGDFESKARCNPLPQVPKRTGNRVIASVLGELRPSVNWTRYLMEGVCNREAQMYSQQALYHSINAAVYPFAMNLCYVDRIKYVVYKRKLWY